MMSPSVFLKQTNNDMIQNILSLNRGKPNTTFFHEGHRVLNNFITIETSQEAMISCRYLIHNKMKFAVELDKMSVKTATAIRSVYILRHPIPLKSMNFTL